MPPIHALFLKIVIETNSLSFLQMIPSRNSTATTTSFPENTFVTYSADSTIRFWNFDNNPISAGGNEPGSSNIKRNIYSKECIKIVYVDPDGTYKSGAVVAAKNDENGIILIFFYIRIIICTFIHSY